jgi:mono/diheme cytochrome c family protein
VGRLWSIPPANLTDAKYADRAGDFGSDGYLFHIIRDGLYTPDGEIRMPSYGHSVDEADAWAIVSYIRALQTAQGVSEPTTDATDNANAGGEG